MKDLGFNESGKLDVHADPESEVQLQELESIAEEIDSTMHKNDPLYDDDVDELAI